MADAAPQVVHTVGEAARGPNSYKTLSECVAAASAGDMVMVLPGVYEERVHIPFPLDVVGRVKGKVRICPPPESALTAQERADAEQLEDELAIAEILHRHGIKQSDHAALSDARAQIEAMGVDEESLYHSGRWRRARRLSMPTRAPKRD